MNDVGLLKEKWKNINYENNYKLFSDLINKYEQYIEKIKMGGGAIAIERQHNRNRLTARERIDFLIDDGSNFLEIGIFSAFGMYEEYGSLSV